MDAYTQKKLAVQQQFRLGSLATYTGQKKVLIGTVKIAGHEKQGGIVIEADGVTATVSPFSLTPLGTAPLRAEPKRRPDAQRNGHAPTSRRSTHSSSRPATIFRNGVAVPPAAAVDPDAA